ncbi:MAG: T9SS type A sorting domain-containing protein [FCB group bacterium]|jgi:WD40 repeat protein
MKDYKIKLFVILMLIICGYSYKLFANDDLIRTLGLGTIQNAVISNDGTKLATCGGGGILIWNVATADTILSIRYDIGKEYSLVFSPDGTQLANLQSNGGSLEIWDVQTGKIINTLYISDWVRDAKYSPDGRKIIACTDNLIYIWDSKTGFLINTSNYTDWSEKIRFTPDGSKIIAGGYDKVIRFWDLQTGNLIDSIPGNFSPILDVRYSPDGSKIACAGNWGDTIVNLWDAKTKSLINTIPTGSSNFKFNFSPDGNKIITGSDNNSIYLWDANTGTLLNTFIGHSKNIYNAYFSPDGTEIISGSDDYTIKIWDTKSGSLLKTVTIKGDYDIRGEVEFSPDGKQFVDFCKDTSVILWNAITGSQIVTLQKDIYEYSFIYSGKWLMGIGSRYIKIWDANTGDSINAFKGFTNNINNVRYSPDGTKIASSNGDMIMLWDANNGVNIKNFIGHTDIITSLCFSPDGTKIVSSSLDRTVKIWNVTNGNLIRTIICQNSFVNSVFFSPDGNKFVCGSYDSTVKIYDVNTGIILKTMNGFPGVVTSVCYSIDGKKIATASYNIIKIWDANLGTEINNITFKTDYIWDIFFNPDGTKLICMGRDGTIIIWDVVSGKEIRTYYSSYGYFDCVSFCPDGTKVAGGEGDTLEGIINFWDVQTGVLIKTYTGHNGYIIDLAFRPDGKTIASGSYDGTIKIWRVPSYTTSKLLIEGRNTTCVFNTETYSTTFTKGHTYKWNVSDGGKIIGSDSLSSVNVNFMTSYQSVTITLIDSDNSSGIKDTAYNAIEVYSLPEQWFDGFTYVCYNNIQSYIFYPADYETFKWDIVGGILIKEVTPSYIYVQWTSANSGTINLTVTNQFTGCVQTISKAVVINDLPIPEINGSQSAFKGSTLLYTAQNSLDSSYKWYVTNGAIIGKNNSNSVIIKWGSQDSGMVKLIETNYNGCVDSVSLKVNLLLDAVDDFTNSNNSLTIFPNPASNELKISYNLNANKYVTISIIDVLGNEVYSATEQGLAGTNNSKIDLSVLPQGVYYLKLSAGADALTRIISVIK